MSDWQLKSDVQDIKEELVGVLGNGSLKKEVSEIKEALLGKGYYDKGLKGEIEDLSKALRRSFGSVLTVVSSWVANCVVESKLHKVRRRIVFVGSIAIGLSR